VDNRNDIRMKLFVEGEIVASVKKSFNDADGQLVNYYANTVQSEDGELSMTGMEVSADQLNVRGVIVIDAQQLFHENGSVKGYKLKLKDFKKGELSEDLAETEIH